MDKEMRKYISGSILLPALIIALAPVALSCGGEGKSGADEAGTAQTSATGTSTQAAGEEEWEDEGLRVGGRYADADVVAFEDGRYRMYFGPEPEVPGFEGQVYSAVSSDGLTWTMEEGERMKFATFPEVVGLPDGTWRMYYQGGSADNEFANGIASAVSADGLNWTKENGFRVRTGPQGSYESAGVADPAVLEFPDGGYLMVYRGQAGENAFGREGFAPGSPAPNDYLLSATSPDGITWTPGGLVVDSNNQRMMGQILGPDLVLDDGRIKLYCNSFEGIYVLEVDSRGRPAGQPELIIRASGSPEAGDLFAPGDVSVVRMGGDWRMFYGLRTKGIHSMIRVR